jgi:hypothetical protein
LTGLTHQTEGGLSAGLLGFFLFRNQLPDEIDPTQSACWRKQYIGSIKILDYSILALK